MLWLFYFYYIEEVKEQNKILRGATRDLERDRNAMEREKKRLVRSFEINLITNSVIKIYEFIVLKGT
jgi:hypothetical protein